MIYWEGNRRTRGEFIVSDIPFSCSLNHLEIAPAPRLKSLRHAADVALSKEEGGEGGGKMVQSLETTREGRLKALVYSRIIDRDIDPSLRRTVTR